MTVQLKNLLRIRNKEGEIKVLKMKIKEIQAKNILSIGKNRKQKDIG